MNYQRVREERMAALLIQFNDPTESPARREQAGRAWLDWKYHGPCLRGIVELIASTQY